MFEAILSIPKPVKFDCPNLRTGIIAGGPVAPAVDGLLGELKMTQYTSSHGRRIMPSPRTSLKLDSPPWAKSCRTPKPIFIDTKGNIVPVGERGELCMAGYQLTKEYWNNPDKTNETFLTDQDGVVWLKAGDETVFTPGGYCTITGRCKYIIVRGGENIYPLEIEERLSAHPAIEVASMIGVPDHKYGEVVGAFIALAASHEARPSDEELRAWTHETLGRHKAPQYVFVFGQEGVARTIPVTGSGKVRKVDLRKIAAKVLERRASEIRT